MDSNATSFLRTIKYTTAKEECNICALSVCFSKLHEKPYCYLIIFNNIHKKRIQKQIHVHFHA